MFSTKIRSTIVPLAIFATFAVTALAPAASQAAPKSGTWQNSCRNAQISYENAKTAWEYSTTEVEATKNYNLMRQIQDSAILAGCSVN